MSVGRKSPNWPDSATALCARITLDPLSRNWRRLSRGGSRHTHAGVAASLLPGHRERLPGSSGIGLAADRYRHADRGLFDALARALEGLSVDWRDLRHILLTHIHPDHMGLASKLIALTGAPLDVHRADNELLVHLTDTDLHRDWQQEILTTAGVSPEM